MSFFFVLLIAYGIKSLFDEIERVERSWREYGTERAREGGGTARWTDFNL
jgi:hypothetical protein